MHPREPIFPVHRHRVMKIRENEKTEHCQHFQRQKFGSKRRRTLHAMPKMQRLAKINSHQSLFGSLVTLYNEHVSVPNRKTVKTLLVTLPADIIHISLRFTLNYITIYMTCQY